MRTEQTNRQTEDICITRATMELKRANDADQLLMTHLSIIDGLIDQWIDFIDGLINIFQ